MTHTTKPFNGRACYRARKTWGSGHEVEHERPARITPKRVNVGLKVFDRATGDCVSKRWPLADYAYRLVWYEVDGGERVTVERPR